MNKDLLVEIFVPVISPPDEGKIGTGYPVADNRILTSRHVLCPPDRDPTKPIEVRWHHQPSTSRHWLKVPEQDILWRGEDICDAAVFACTFPADAGPWGTLALESPRPEDWESEGFPEIGKRDDETRVATGMRGAMHRMPKIAQFFALDLPVGADCAAKHRGASGSPVMSGGKLYGVIVECPPGFNGQRLWAVPSCRLLEMPGFCKAIGHTPQTVVLDLLGERMAAWLAASEEARATLDTHLSAAAGNLATRHAEPWAKRLVETLLRQKLEDLVPMLRRAHRNLCEKQEFKAADTIARISNAILPIVFDRAPVFQLQSRMFDADVALITVPVATYTVAEIVMAAAEGRPGCFGKTDSGAKAPVATHRLKEPPTAGFDSKLEEGIKNIERDLANRLIDPEDDVFLDDEHRRQLVADRLNFASEEQKTLYMAFRFKSDEERKKTADALLQLKRRYPALVMLDLSTEPSLIAQEKRLFQYFEEILKTSSDGPKP